MRKASGRHAPAPPDPCPDAKRRPRAALSFALLLTALLQGCAAPPQTAAVLALPAGALPTRQLLAEVPFHPQADYQCGPAALAMTMAPAGVDVHPDALVEQVYLPARLGSLQPEIVATVRRHGLVPYPLAPSLTALLQEVAAGHPVLVLQNLSLPAAPQWHYAVVIGFDLPRRELILHSGPEARQRLPLATFERTWARGDHWALLALPPSTLPANADAERWLAAAVDLERTSRSETALIAYETALTRWPDNFTALVGRGNAAAALGRYEVAADAFGAATRVDPTAGIAWNNLAHVLARLGQLPAAEVAARRAVALGGPHAATFAATLQQIVEQSAAP